MYKLMPLSFGGTSSTFLLVVPVFGTSSRIFGTTSLIFGTIS